VIKPVLVLFFGIILLFPSFAGAQSVDRITLLDNFGEFKKGDQFFVFGNVAQISPESFLIIQIINPNGELCQIQQIKPLADGQFLTGPIPLSGRICGFSGQYEVKVFYGDYFTNAKFNVIPETVTEKTGIQYLESASQLVSDKIQSINEKIGFTQPHSERFDIIIEQSSDNTILELKDLYVDLWDSFFEEEKIFDVDINFRVPIQNALDTTSELLESGKISFETTQEIEKIIFAAMFYSQIDDHKNALAELNNVYVLIENVNPTKITSTKSITFEQLENTLLNLMTKTQSILSESIQEEIALILSRGTAPLYASELNELLDTLTKSRFLDIISRNNGELYQLIILDWDNTRESLIKKQTIDEFLTLQDKVNSLHQASLLLRNLDDVDRFVTSNKNENSELANIILPEWKQLESNLFQATSVDDILNSKTDIENMSNVIDISSRITKTVEISKKVNVNADLITGWESLLLRVDSANSVSEMIEIVSDFEQSLNAVREKQNPLSVLKFEYQSMKTKAELQADHKNLIDINNALKIIDIAEKMQKGNPSVNKIDRIDILLTWASSKIPTIKTELYSYSKPAYEIRASDILQRAKSVENLVELGMIKNRFLPGYEEFTFSMKDRINEARNLVIQKDLDQADNIIRNLFDEWQEVSKAYAEDPLGSDVGYSLDELQRIEYRQKIETYSNLVSQFYNADFAPYADKFVQMTEKTYELIDYGNFLDANSQLSEIQDYLADTLVLQDKTIIFDVSYNNENDIWILEGFVDKELYNQYYVDDRRDELKLTIFSMDGSTYGNLEFANTRHGKFFTQWHAPTEPGLYVVVLHFKAAKASQIINIQDKTTRIYSASELSDVELAREFEELRTFVEEFGGNNYDTNKIRFLQTFENIKDGLASNDSKKVTNELDKLQKLIERYLPVRSRSAIIEASMEGDQLHLSGAVQKTLSFSEDLFVDIFDQRGDPIDEIELHDSTSGYFDEKLSKPYPPGIYVAQLQYHDLTVTDFFTVR